MSGFVALSIDFETGDFRLEERPAIAGQSTPPVRQGRLSTTAIARLRQQATTAVRAGLTTPECRRRFRDGRPMMPNIDAMPSMTVTLRNRAANAPVDIGCWSNAANRLSNAALTAARES